MARLVLTSNIDWGIWAETRAMDTLGERVVPLGSAPAQTTGQRWTTMMSNTLFFREWGYRMRRPGPTGSPVGQDAHSGLHTAPQGVSILNSGPVGVLAGRSRPTWQRRDFRVTTFSTCNPPAIPTCLEARAESPGLGQTRRSAAGKIRGPRTPLIAAAAGWSPSRSVVDVFLWTPRPACRAVWWRRGARRQGQVLILQLMAAALRR